MKKQQSIFTAELGRQFRSAAKDGVLIVNHKNGVIYASNGFFAVILTADEYDRFVRPVTNRAPGNFRIKRGDFLDGEQNVLDIPGIFKSALANKAMAGLRALPLTVTDSQGRKIVFLHNPDNGEIHVFNAAYTGIFSGCLFEIAAPLSPAIVLHLDDGASIDQARVVGLVLPVNPNANAAAVRAAHAYCNNDAPQASNDNALHAELDKANARAKQAEQRATLDRKAAAQKIAELEKANAALRAALASAAPAAATQQPAEQPQAASASPAAQPAAPTTAQAIADKLASLPGVTATIKGAQTAVPIVWLTGSVKRHRAAIEQAGGKWSNKRAAYYIRCA